MIVDHINPQNALLDYIKNNRSAINTLDIKQFVELIATPGIDLNAQDQNGKTALHYLVSGGGTFKYARSLISSGADVGKFDNRGQSPLHIVIQEERQGQLLFLLLANYYKKNIALPDDLSNHPEIKPILDLFNFKHDEENEFGKILRKLITNDFDFHQLTRLETGFLNDIKKLNATTKDPDSESSNNSSDSDSEMKPKPTVQQIFSGLGFENDINLINISRGFFSNFAHPITEKYNLEVELLEERRKAATALVISLKRRGEREEEVSNSEEVKQVTHRYKEAIDIPIEIAEMITGNFDFKEAKDMTESLLLANGYKPRPIVRKIEAETLAEDHQNQID